MKGHQFIENIISSREGDIVNVDLRHNTTGIKNKFMCLITRQVDMRDGFYTTECINTETLHQVKLSTDGKGFVEISLMENAPYYHTLDNLVELKFEKLM